MMFLRARTLALGAAGLGRSSREAMLDLLNAGITPVVPEYGSLGRERRPRPARPCRTRDARRGRGRPSTVATPAAGDALAAAGLEPIDARREGGPGGHQRHRRDPRDALPGGRRRRPPAHAGRHRRCDDGRGCARAPTPPFAADLQALRPHPGQAVSAANLRAMLAGSPIVASHATRRPARAGRLLDPVHTRRPRRGPRHARSRPPRRRVGARLGDRQPDGAARRPGRVVRQLPRRAARVRRRLPRDRPRRDRIDRRAPDGPAARPDAQPRPAAVPRRRGRCRLAA